MDSPRPDVPDYDRFIDFFTNFVSFYQSFLEVETDKYGLLLHGRLAEYCDLVNQEQACVLKSRGLEKERERLFESMGCPDATFRELITVSPAEHKPALHQLFLDLSGILTELKAVNLRCRHLAELRLRAAEQQAAHLRDKLPCAASAGSGHDAEQAVHRSLSRMV